MWSVLFFPLVLNHLGCQSSSVLQDKVQSRDRVESMSQYYQQYTLKETTEQMRHIPRSDIPWSWSRSYFLKFLEGISHFCGATDTPILDFW